MSFIYKHVFKDKHGVERAVYRDEYGRFRSRAEYEKQLKKEIVYGKPFWRATVTLNYVFHHKYYAMKYTFYTTSLKKALEFIRSEKAFAKLDEQFYAKYHYTVQEMIVAGADFQYGRAVDSIPFDSSRNNVTVFRDEYLYTKERKRKRAVAV